MNSINNVVQKAIWLIIGLIIVGLIAVAMPPKKGLSVAPTNDEAVTLTAE